MSYYPCFLAVDYDPHAGFYRFHDDHAYPMSQHHYHVDRCLFCHRYAGLFVNLCSCCVHGCQLYFKSVYMLLLEFYCCLIHDQSSMIHFRDQNYWSHGWNFPCLHVVIKYVLCVLLLSMESNYLSDQYHDPYFGSIRQLNVVHVYIELLHFGYVGW